MLGGLQRSQPLLLANLAPTADGSAMMPRATVETAGSLAANAGYAGATPESGVAKPVGPEKQLAPPEASQGVVGPAVQPWSHPVVPTATVEEDEVEEIEHEESRPRTVQIIHKRGNEVVVVEEEDTTKELRRLESTLVRVMKQIKVSTAFVVFSFDVGDCSSS